MSSVTALTAAVLVVLVGGDPAPTAVPGEAWIALIGFGVFSAFAVAAFLGGTRRIGAARAALVSTFEPVYTIVMATILLGESLSPLQVLGGGLVVLGRAARGVGSARAVGRHRSARGRRAHPVTPSALGCEVQEARGDRCDSPRSSRPTARTRPPHDSRWNGPMAACCPRVTSAAAMPDTIEALLAGGDAALAALRTAAAAVAPPRPALDPSSVQVIAPVPRPGKVIAVGLNYFDHAKEGGVEPPAEPMLFAKFTTSVVGPGATVEWDPGPDRVGGPRGGAGRGHRPHRPARAGGRRALVRPRLHLRQRRQRPRPPEVGQAVRARQVAGHVLPDGTRHRDRPTTSPTPSASPIRSFVGNRVAQDSNTSADDLQRGPDRSPSAPVPSRSSRGMSSRRARRQACWSIGTRPIGSAMGT